MSDCTDMHWADDRDAIKTALREAGLDATVQLRHFATGTKLVVECSGQRWHLWAFLDDSPHAPVRHGWEARRVDGEHGTTLFRRSDRIGAVGVSGLVRRLAERVTEVSR